MRTIRLEPATNSDRPDLGTPNSSDGFDEVNHRFFLGFGGVNQIEPGVGLLNVSEPRLKLDDVTFPAHVDLAQRLDPLGMFDLHLHSLVADFRAARGQR